MNEVERGIFDMFAMSALQGPALAEYVGRDASVARIAEGAYAIATAMIAERKRLRVPVRGPNEGW
jgi:hypothetical protein